MGRSAKVHKRVSALICISAHSHADCVLYRTKKRHPAQQPVSKQTQARKANLKGKAKNNSSNRNTGVGVLGGADYVTLMGSGRKAKEEAAKLANAS